MTERNKATQCSELKGARTDVVSVIDALIEQRRQDAFERQIELGKQTITTMERILREKKSQNNYGPYTKNHPSSISKLEKYLDLYKSGHEYIQREKRPGPYRVKMLHAVACFYYLSLHHTFAQTQIVGDHVMLYTKNFIDNQNRFSKVEITPNGDSPCYWDHDLGTKARKKYLEVYHENRQKHIKIWQALENTLRSLGVYQKLSNLIASRLGRDNTLEKMIDEYLQKDIIFLCLSFDHSEDFEKFGMDAEFYRLNSPSMSKVSQDGVFHSSLQHRYDDPAFYGKEAHSRGHDFDSYAHRLEIKGEFPSMESVFTHNAGHESTHGIIDALLILILDIQDTRFRFIHEAWVIAANYDSRYCQVIRDYPSYIKAMLKSTEEDYLKDPQSYLYVLPGNIMRGLFFSDIDNPPEESLNLILQTNPYIGSFDTDYDVLKPILNEIFAIIEAIYLFPSDNDHNKILTILSVLLIYQALRLSEDKNFSQMSSLERQKNVLMNLLHLWSRQCIEANHLASRPDQPTQTSP